MKNKKIQISNNKILKLSNVLVKSVDLYQNKNLEKEVVQMENFLKNRGAIPMGPLIQYTNIEHYGNTEPKVEIKIMRQSNAFINDVEEQYRMESIIRVKNCMYARYTGEESKLKFAYDKINLIAFEEDIPLKGDCYTIFVNSNDDGIIADVFMERADNE